MREERPTLTNLREDERRNCGNDETVDENTDCRARSIESMIGKWEKYKEQHSLSSANIAPKNLFVDFVYCIIDFIVSATIFLTIEYIFYSFIFIFGGVYTYMFPLLFRIFISNSIFPTGDNQLNFSTTNPECLRCSQI